MTILFCAGFILDSTADVLNKWDLTCQVYAFTSSMAVQRTTVPQRGAEDMLNMGISTA